MMKQSILFLFIFASLTFAYLPVSFNSTPVYSTTNQLLANVTDSTVNATLIGVNNTCTYPSGYYLEIPATNSSDIFWSLVPFNESGFWNCSSVAYDSTTTEVNYTNYTLACPSSLPIDYNLTCYALISLTLDTSIQYFDIGDNVTLWANLTNSSLVSSLYVYSSDNTTKQFQYSILKQMWYVYYTVKQSQEVLIVESFTAGGTPTGIGEYTLTYNPNPPTASMWEMWSADLGKYVMLIIIAVLGLGLLIVVGPMVFSLIFQNQ